jgi:schlafen family protein
MKPRGLESRVLIRSTLTGVLGGLGFVHPFSMIVYLVQFRAPERVDPAGLVTLLLDGFESFGPAMIGMGVAYAILGALVGVLWGKHTISIQRGRRVTAAHGRVLATSLPGMVAGGETSDLEFKSSLRWDRRTGSINKSLEAVVVKTIGGFMNAAGGVVLVGVDDEGSAVGIAEDYLTLKKSDADGFQQHVMHLVASRLGADLCPKVEVGIQKLSGHDVAVIVVLPADRPVYLDRGNARAYYLRTGNSTRALNTEEAVEHVQKRYFS